MDLGMRHKKRTGAVNGGYKTIRQQALPRLYTYCASYRQVAPGRCRNVFHLLPEIMNVEETIPLHGVQSLFNRVALSTFLLIFSINP